MILDDSLCNISITPWIFVIKNNKEQIESR